MRIEKFNSLPKQEKLVWLKKRLQGQPITRCNVIFFRTKVVFLMFSNTGEAIMIDAEKIDPALGKEVSDFLNEENIICFNIICDSTEAFRQKKLQAIWKHSGKYN